MKVRGLPLILMLAITLTLVISPSLGVQMSLKISSSGTITHYTHEDIKMVHGIWITKYDLLGQPDIDRRLQNLLDGKIKFICLDTGEWRDDGTIALRATPTEIAECVNLIRRKSDYFKILGWVHRAWAPLDIRDPARRQAMADLSVQHVKDHNLDGFNDDLENIVGTWGDLVDLWNRQATALRGIGKIASSCTMVFSYMAEATRNLNTDYAFAMVYNGGVWDRAKFQSSMDLILTRCASPTLIGILVQQKYPFLRDQLAFIEEQLAAKTYDRFKGISIFQYKAMRDVDWVDWNASPIVQK